MNTEPLSFQKVVDALVENRKEFPQRYLREFSDLGNSELKTVLDAWPQVDLSRKMALLEDLNALADNDTLVSFDDFARALLTDPDAQVRTRAIRLLDESEALDLVPSYLDMLNNDPDISVRAEAARVLNLFVDLGELEEIPETVHRQVEDALLMAVTSEDDVRVRRAALESLGYSSRPEVATLIESAFHREDPHWQTSALIAISARVSNLFDSTHSTFGLLGEADEVLGNEFDDARFVSPGAPRAAWVGLRVSLR